MSYINVGDVVQYIHECSDHYAAPDSLQVGNWYVVTDIGSDDNSVLLRVNDHYDWWVSEDCVATKEEVQGLKYYKVIRKIKQMDARRKEQGYAF